MYSTSICSMHLSIMYCSIIMHIMYQRLGRRCLLGERIVYEKRVSGECCINGPDYEIPIGRSTCECAIEDFEW